MDNLNIQELNEMNMGVEIQDFTEPNLTVDEKMKIIKFYKEEFKNLNNIKALHGPFLDLKLASPDKEIKDVSYKRHLSTIKTSIDLGIDYIVFHSPINPYLNLPMLKDLNNKQYGEAWIELLKEVPNYKGTILIENVFEEDPSMLKELIETIDLSNIKINLDLGHAKLGKVGIEEWIRELKDHIAYMHIHSNNGIYDIHSAPREKEIKRLYDLLDKYSINPVLSLEYNIENLKQEIKKYR